MKRPTVILLAAVAMALALTAAILWRQQQNSRTFYTDGQTIRQSLHKAVVREILWQPPVWLPETINTSDDEIDVAVSGDGHMLLLSRRGPNTGVNADIYSAIREPGASSRRDGWLPPQPVWSLNTEFDETSPAISFGGEIVFFSSNRPGGLGGYDLWMSRRDDDSHRQWLPPVNLGPAVNSEFDDNTPAISPDGLTLYFASNRPVPKHGDDADEANGRSASDENLYSAVIHDDQFEAAALLAGLNTSAREHAPTISPAGDFLYFASDRPGGHGGSDLYRARIVRGQIQSSSNLGPEINTLANETSPALTVAGYELHFSSDRRLSAQEGPQSPASFDIYRAQSREVFTEVEARQPIDWASLLSAILPALWWLLVALALLLLSILLLRAVQSRRLTLLARCLLASLLVHLIILLLLTFWQVTTTVSELIRREGGMIVALTSPVEGDQLLDQVRGNLTQVNLSAELASASRRETQTFVEHESQHSELEVDPVEIARIDAPLAAVIVQESNGESALASTEALEPVDDSAAATVDLSSPAVAAASSASESQSATPDAKLSPTQRSDSGVAVPASLVTVAATPAAIPPEATHHHAPPQPLTAAQLASASRGAVAANTSMIKVEPDPVAPPDLTPLATAAPVESANPVPSVESDATVAATLANSAKSAPAAAAPTVSTQTIAKTPARATIDQPASSLANTRTAESIVDPQQPQAPAVTASAPPAAVATPLPVEAAAHPISEAQQQVPQSRQAIATSTFTPAHAFVNAQTSNARIAPEQVSAPASSATLIASASGAADAHPREPTAAPATPATAIDAQKTPIDIKVATPASSATANDAHLAEPAPHIVAAGIASSRAQHAPNSGATEQHLPAPASATVEPLATREALPSANLATIEVRDASSQPSLTVAHSAAVPAEVNRSALAVAMPSGHADSGQVPSEIQITTASPSLTAASAGRAHTATSIQNAPPTATALEPVNSQSSQALTATSLATVSATRDAADAAANPANAPGVFDAPPTALALDKIAVPSESEHAAAPPREVNATPHPATVAATVSKARSSNAAVPFSDTAELVKPQLDPKLSTANLSQASLAAAPSQLDHAERSATADLPAFTPTGAEGGGALPDVARSAFPVALPSSEADAQRTAQAARASAAPTTHAAQSSAQRAAPRAALSAPAATSPVQIKPAEAAGAADRAHATNPILARDASISAASKAGAIADTFDQFAVNDISRHPALAPSLPSDVPPPVEAYGRRAEPQRAEILEKMGGGPETEAAVKLALAWLARHQAPDGRWAAARFDAHCGECGGAGRYHNDIATTALALLCFLGADHTHDKPNEYRDHVQRGLDWLRSQQKHDGDLRGSETMYSHAIASIALSEAYGMTRDEQLLSSLKSAIEFIVNARNRNVGGWRYEPGQAGDTSVLGWVVMAMVSAKRAGVNVPDDAFKAAARWLDIVDSQAIPGRYAYQPGQRFSPPMTAEGMYVQQLLGMPHSAPRMAQSADYVIQHLPQWSDSNTYFWYYATLAMFQHQGEHWERWNDAMRRALLANQITTGPAAGSWDPVDNWAKIGGRVYQTALCTLSLEVYYRYLPLYEQIESARSGSRAAD